ncbi:MAG: hypothetical protein MdMp024_0366 [Bacteroidales bacterium]
MAGVQAHADGTINMANPGGGNGWTFGSNVVRITTNGNYTVTGTSAVNRIMVSRGVTATVTLDNAVISNAGVSPFVLTSDETGGSQVTLELKGTNKLITTDVYSAGLTVEDNAKITIEGDGSLLAQGAGVSGHGGAGIGGGENKLAGTIIINSGTITATGGALAAGIGGGFPADWAAAHTWPNLWGTGDNVSGGNIIINGGTVTAYGGYQAAGIGGGCYANGGNITINGGTVVAIGGWCGAGIGGGDAGQGGVIVINDGTVTAIGGPSGTGIGGGNYGAGGSITINKGIIIAVTPGGGGDPAGIGGGGGSESSAGFIQITGGAVYASGGTGPGIGSGAYCTKGFINITGGVVAADKIGIGEANGTTETHISGVNTIVLSPSVNTTNFGGAKFLTGTDIGISCTVLGENVDYRVVLYEDLTILPGTTLIIPQQIVFDLNHKVLTNEGIVWKYGLIINDMNWRGNTPAPVQIAAGWIEDIPAQAYAGDSIKPALTIQTETDILTQDIDYTVAYSNNVYPGTATATVTGVGDYTGTASKTFTIMVKQVSAGWFEPIPDQTWTGIAIRPALTITDGNRILILDTDYTVEYSGNTNVGTATATIAGTGNYTGTASVQFTINPKPVADDWIETIPDQTWTGIAIRPAITVMDGGKTLILDTDYTVRYSDNTNAGTATVTVTGRGNYGGTATRTFGIIRLQVTIQESWIQTISDQTWTGSPVRPSLTIRDGSRTLILGTDYTVEYFGNTNEGTATVMVTGKGNYIGSATATFRIVRNRTVIQESWIQNISDQIYTGSKIEPEVTVSGLALNTDYTVAYSGNIDPGTASVTITGIENYTGTVTKTFNIIRASGLDPNAGDSAVMYPVEVVLAVKDEVKSFVTLSFVSANVGAGTTVPLVIHIEPGIETDVPVVYANGSEVYVSSFDTEHRNYIALIPVNANTNVIVGGLRLLADTGREEPAAGRLHAVATEGGWLLISGLTPGEPFGIYNLQGRLIYQATASSPEEHIHLRDKNIYILIHKDKAFKFNW